MNEESQRRKILRFLKGKPSKDVDAFCLYQWVERCHYHGWWDLGVSLGSYIPPNSLSDHYYQRINFLLKECRNHFKPIPKKDSNAGLASEINADTLESYTLFKNQKKALIEALRDYDRNIKIEFDWKDLNENHLKQKLYWFFIFYPPGWDKSTFATSGKRLGFGVHFAFIYYFHRRQLTEYARLSVGVESPLKNGYKRQFKEEIIRELRPFKEDFSEFELWPTAGVHRGSKLLDIKMPLDSNTWKQAMEYYKRLNPFTLLVSKKIKEFRENGYFK
jgi:hypothetical protein